LGKAAPAPKYVLAIDHGTSGCKTALVSVTGHIAGFEFEATPTERLPGGGVEQDPDRWWSALAGTARRLTVQGLVEPEQIAAVCCSSTFSSTVAVDQQGRHLLPALTWMDSRGAAEVQRRMKGLLNVMGFGLGNILRWVPRTGGAPTLSGKDSIAHMLWVQKEHPELYERAAAFLESKDYLNLRLCGRVAASYDSAMLFWVTDIRDINNVRYDPRLIRRLGIDAKKLPPLLASTDVLGPVLPEVADELGIPRGVPVVAGSPDLQSACVGSGAVRDYEAHIYVGTSSWVLCHVPFKKTDIFHAIASLPSAIPGRYFTANEQDMAGGCLEYLIHHVLYQEALGQTPPDDVYARLDELAAAAPAGAKGLMFLPWLNGEKTPVDDETLRGGFYNMGLGHETSHMVRAVYEGVALNTRWVLTHLERFVDRRLDPLNIIGGGARSGVWCQIFADVLGRTIRQVRDPLQANARGAAFIAAVALGEITFDQIPELVSIAETFEPNPESRRVYDGLFCELEKIYKGNHAIHRRLQKLFGDVL